MIPRYLKYLQIPYRHQGRDFRGADCFGLMRLFYQTELGVELPDFTEDYPEDWFTQKNYLLELYAQHGFEPTTSHEFGNVIFFRNTSTSVGHLGVMLDGGHFIHMNRSGCSINSYLTGVWHRQMHSVYRLQREAA